MGNELEPLAQGPFTAPEPNLLAVGFFEAACVVAFCWAFAELYCWFTGWLDKRNKRK